ncbi:MAG: class I SAM-dependent DNA methyltransferase, partial [Candidatus Omnitrophica bacterium]|nr:class I SAM-dependent DNA methyltransferase [Candidatus Omnitrophota bacterium]
NFDLSQYTELVKNLFNNIQIQSQEIRVPDSSKEFIKKITFLSEFSDTEQKTIDIYAVELVGNTKVERARSFQRNLISKLLKDNTKDAGLAAFYSQDNPDWRLSFIKLDYKLTEKGVKVEVGTPPKRYSFLVGEAEPSHTAQKQLLPIFEDHKNNPLLSDLEEAFSVEKVTKEFYERYRKLFEDLSKDLKKNRAFQIIAEKENIDIDNFAKKLLGQIVFLYFLQKKGWLGVPQDKTWGQGDKFFLRTLFDKAKKGKDDFYDHYLEHLFYDTLNNPRRDEVDPAYSRYFDCKIPFLNGGLFEPDYDWKNTIVYLGNEIFEEIIDTFDLYNFTVKEDEPWERFLKIFCRKICAKARARIIRLEKLCITCAKKA